MRVCIYWTDNILFENKKNSHFYREIKNNAVKQIFSLFHFI